MLLSTLGGDVFSLAIDLVSPQTLYVDWLKSTDGGESWQSTAPFEYFGIVYSLAIDPLTPQIVYAGTDSGIYESTNAGSSWALFQGALTDSVIVSLAINPLLPQLLYAGTRRACIS